MANKELSPEMRVVMAFAISLLIIFALQPLLVRQSPPAAMDSKSGDASAPAASSDTPAVSAPQPPEPPRTEPAPPDESVRQGEQEEQITVVGDLYRVVISTRGAVVSSWQLTRFRDARKGPLELLNEAAAREFGQPLMVWTGEQELREQVNRALFVSSHSGEVRAPATLTFEYSSGGIRARKRLRFQADRYDVSIESSLERAGQPVAHQLAWRGSFGDVHDSVQRGTMVDVFIRQPENLLRLHPTNLTQEGFLAGAGRSLSETLGLRDPRPAISEVTHEGQFQFAGIEDHFFTAAAVSDGQPLRVTAFAHELTIEGQERKQPSVGFAVGASGSAPSNVRLYVGPKDSAVLAQAAPELAQLVDLGWFSIVATPLYHSLRWIHDNIVANYGWAIVLLTLVINLLLLPLKISSFRSARKMQAIAPQLRSIQDKYKGLKMNDPKRHQMSQETMELYRKHGVNPVGGCLPLLVQLPFLIGFYNVLNSSIEMRQAAWIAPWITDLSVPEQIPIRLLPLLMCGSQFIMQKMTPTPGVDPMQQKIMLFMPVMFLFMFWGMASGLVLYWTVGNVVGIAQQWYFNRTHQLQEVEAKQAKKARKTK